jgi:hypothetical protein
MAIQIEPEYKIGDRAYLNVPDSDPYTVVNWSFEGFAKTFEYELLGYAGAKGWYKSSELSKEKTF